jgi:hypothetical protein
MGKKKEQPLSRSEKIKERLFLIVLPLFLTYVFGNYFISNSLLRRGGYCTKGILVSTTLGGHSSPKFWYHFRIDGKTYDGLVAQDGVSKLGDSICIVYWPRWPHVNRPFSFFDAGEVRCDCK